MKKFLLLILLPISGVQVGYAQTEAVPDRAAEYTETSPESYANTITAEELSEHLYVIASDSLEGREAGEKGQKMAADYLASQFKQYGLIPPVKTDKGFSYYQQFNLVKKEWQDVYIKVNKKKYEFLKDFYAYGDLNMPQENEMKMVFAGYGIDHKNYSDYKGLDVEGKGVVIFMGEPVVGEVSAVTGTSEFSEAAFDWRAKVETARKKGAAAVFMVVGENYDQFEKRLNVLKPHLKSPTLGFTYKQRTGTFFVPGTLAAEMLKTTEDKLYMARNSLGESVPAVKSFKSAKVKAKAGVEESVFQTENVLGLVEGSDKKEEIIVVTAHYDHLGIEDGKIHNGADDDGSGTVALLEMAEAFAAAKENGHGPRRSILFMPVTAEEKGLLGSEYYSDNPVFPLENTVANLNIDMIGREDSAHRDNPNYVYLIGSDRLSTELHEVSESVAERYMPDFELDYRFNAKDDPNRFYYRSDHYNFAKHNIPVIFYFNGVHEDYHQPTDTVDKILFPKVEKTTKLIFYTAWELANREERVSLNAENSDN